MYMYVIIWKYIQTYNTKKQELDLQSHVIYKLRTNFITV